jgi:hypothetical protein
VSGLNDSYQMAASYTIIVTLIVSVAAILFLKISGAFGKRPEGK